MDKETENWTESWQYKLCLATGTCIRKKNAKPTESKHWERWQNKDLDI